MACVGIPENPNTHCWASQVLGTSTAQTRLLLQPRGLTKKEWSLKVGVSGVPWLYMDILLWSAAVLFPVPPEDGVVSSTSKGLQNNRRCPVSH